MDKDIEKKLDEFFSQYKPLNYKKGDILIRAEDPIIGIYLLKKGFVKQSIISEDGEELTINIFRPISFFPSMLIIGNTQNKYNFEAVDDLEVWRAPVEKVIDFLKNNPDVLFDLTRRLSQGLNGLAQRLEELVFQQAYNRVISLLVYLSSRFGEDSPEGMIIQIPVTHKDIAAWTGLTRETSSRQIEKLIAENLISYNNHHQIIIKNAPKLQELSEKSV